MTELIERIKTIRNAVGRDIIVSLFVSKHKIDIVKTINYDYPENEDDLVSDEPLEINKLDVKEASSNLNYFG